MDIKSNGLGVDLMCEERCCDSIRAWSKFSCFRLPPMSVCLSVCQEVRDMILRYPPILLSNIDNNIKPKVRFALQAGDNVSRHKSTVPRLVSNRGSKHHSFPREGVT